MYSFKREFKIDFCNSISIMKFSIQYKIKSKFQNNLGYCDY